GDRGITPGREPGPETGVGGRQQAEGGWRNLEEEDVMRKPGNLLLLAIVIGALAAALVYRHLRELRSEIDAARQTAPGTVDIVVASDTIPAGGRVGEQQVKLAAWPETIVPEGAIKDTKAVINSVARVTIEKNQPLSQSQLLGQGAEVLPLMIPEGMRAMSVRVDDVT